MHVYWKNDEIRVIYVNIFRFPYLLFRFYTTKHSKTESEWEPSVNKLEKGLKSTRTLIITPPAPLKLIMRLTSR